MNLEAARGINKQRDEAAVTGEKLKASAEEFVAMIHSVFPEVYDTIERILTDMQTALDAKDIQNFRNNRSLFQNQLFNTGFKTPEDVVRGNEIREAKEEIIRLADECWTMSGGQSLRTLH